MSDPVWRSSRWMVLVVPLGGHHRARTVCEEVGVDWDREARHERLDRVVDIVHAVVTQRALEPTVEMALPHLAKDRRAPGIGERGLPQIRDAQIVLIVV